MKLKIEVNKESIEQCGCKVVRSYMLVNNYGYIIEKHGITYDLRFWENLYGCSPMKWGIDGRSGYFKDNEEVLEYLTNL